MSGLSPLGRGRAHSPFLPAATIWAMRGRVTPACTARALWEMPNSAASRMASSRSAVTAATSAITASQRLAIAATLANACSRATSRWAIASRAASVSIGVGLGMPARLAGLQNGSLNASQPVGVRVYPPVQLPHGHQPLLAGSDHPHVRLHEAFEVI